MRSTNKRAQVLIVDDDPALLEALSETLQLRMERVNVETCASALTALERLSGTDYDAIVADIKMPGMDGLELLARIREVRPQTPTLLITGHGQHDLAVQALRGGAHDYVQKPIDRDYFVRSLNHAISKRRLSRKVAQRRQTLEKQTRELERCVEERATELRELYGREALARAALEKTSAELEAARSRRDELVSMIAHDLSTPLTTVRGYAQRLARPDLPKSERERATGIIISESGRMIRLVQDLLENRHGSPSGFSLQLAEGDLATLARDQVEIARARSKRHTLVLEAPEHLALTYDRERIAQVFANLLGNAVAYTPRGEIRVRVWRDGPNAYLSVADHGPGIPRDSLETIFEPGVRLRPRKSTSGPSGSGLGLSIVREIVQAHGGRIWAESTPGEGAVFSVALPIQAGAEVHPHQAADGALAGSTS